MKRLVLFVSALALVFGAPLAPRARADDATDILAFVRDAYLNLLTLDSFTSSSDQIYTLRMTVLRNDITFDYAAAITSEVIPGEGMITAHTTSDIQMTSNTAPQPMTVTTEFFMDDSTDSRYGRITAANLGTDQDAALVARGWVALPDSSSPAYNGLNENVFFELYGMNYPLVEGVPAKVTELPQIELDGQAMRVFQFEFTSVNIEDAGVMNNFVNVFNGWAMVGVPDATQQMLHSAYFTFTVWIGEDDHLPHAFLDNIVIESEITMSGMTMPVSGEMTLATNLVDINPTLTLTAPEVD